jgi:hypothetical protein
MPRAQATSRAPQPAEAVAAAASHFVRAEHIAAGYTPGQHIRRTLSIAAVISAFGITLATRAHAADWLMMPVIWVVGNFIEWAFHRFPMHRPLTPRLLYKNHAQLHHLAFTDANMETDSPRDLGLIMMPWYTMVGLFVVASPVMLLAGALRGPGLAGVFLLGAVAYFLFYETLHALYHLPDATLDRIGVGRWRLFRRLQAHHAHHHVLRRMSHVNFNVTIPLMDWLLRTGEQRR